jgi:hypothetical protein
MLNSGVLSLEGERTQDHPEHSDGDDLQYPVVIPGLNRDPAFLAARPKTSRTPEQVRGDDDKKDIDSTRAELTFDHRGFPTPSHLA